MNDPVLFIPESELPKKTLLDLVNELNVIVEKFSNSIDRLETTLKKSIWEANQ